MVAFNQLNIEDSNEDVLADLDKNSTDISPGISQLPYSPEDGKQEKCIDKERNIDSHRKYEIDVGDIDIDWDTNFDDIAFRWDDVNIDIDESNIGVTIREYDNQYYEEDYITLDTTPIQS